MVFACYRWVGRSFHNLGSAFSKDLPPYSLLFVSSTDGSRSLHWSLDLRLLDGYIMNVNMIDIVQKIRHLQKYVLLHLHEIVEGLYFHCSWSVCLSVCVTGSACEQNFSQRDDPFWTRFSLTGCLPHWLELYWNWWPWVKGQGHSNVIPIFSS